MSSQQCHKLASGDDRQSQEGVRSRRRILQIGAALAAGAVAATMLEQQQTSAALQLGDVQGESDGPDAGVAGINTADGPGVLAMGIDGPALRAVNLYNSSAIRAETETSPAIDAYSNTGFAIHATSDDHPAMWVESANWTALTGSSGLEFGVRGISDNNAGVRGESPHIAGVQGHSETGRGVHGDSRSGEGVFGESIEAAGVYGTSLDGPGVHGKGAKRVGVIGHSVEDAGVFGTSETIAGVRGYSGEKIGVEGLCPYGTGVEGYSVTQIGVRGNTASGIGVLAETLNNTGRALQVQGRGHFQTAGNAVIPAGEAGVFVGQPLTTAVSHVSATLMADPTPEQRGGPTILYVARVPDSGFHIYLTDRVAVDTPVSYLVVEPIIQYAPVDPTRQDDSGRQQRVILRAGDPRRGRSRRAWPRVMP